MAGLLFYRIRRMNTLSHQRTATQNDALSLYGRPRLIIDPGEHTGTVRSMDVDSRQHWLVTGAEDKTVRIWSLSDNSLYRAIYLPTGPGYIGQAYAVAISPDGKLIAVGGWMRYTEQDPEEHIYLYDRETGALVHRIQGLPMQVCALAFSPDGDLLAASLGGSGLRIFRRAQNWGEFARDEAYGGASFAAVFAPDGRLATSCCDGMIRLYHKVTQGNLQPAVTAGCSIGRPRGLAFSPNDGGARLAIGFNDKALTEIRDGQNLRLLYDPKHYESLENITSMKDLDIEKDRLLSYGSFRTVAWSNDGEWLFAAGDSGMGNPLPIIAWPKSEWQNAIQPAYVFVSLQLYERLLTRIIMLADGDLLAAGSKGTVWRFAHGGDKHHWQCRARHENPLFSFRTDNQDLERNPSEEGDVTNNLLSVSRDGTIVDFHIIDNGARRAEDKIVRFDVNTRQLTLEAPSDEKTRPTHIGKAIDGNLNELQIGDIGVSGWAQTSVPPFALFSRVVDVDELMRLTVNGRRIQLGPNERVTCLAAHPNEKSFVVGCEWSLRAYDERGELLWKADTSTVRGVNIAANGRLVIAAHADHTIRWRRMSDGIELLAFTMLANGSDWAAWTPEGFYSAPPATRGLLRWHSNDGWDAPAAAVPIHEIPGSLRPGVLPLVLTELELICVIGILGLAHNRKIAMRTHAKLPPGAHLHLLAIGISRYKSEHGTSLQLQFADADAAAFAEQLLKTQEGGVYSQVKLQVLLNEDADGRTIFSALHAMKQTARTSSEKDLFVFFFSGHGFRIDDKLYLLPQDVDAKDQYAVSKSGLRVDDLREILHDIANHGRVLVLIDACHSGAITNTRGIRTMNAASLREVLARQNVTVLTSSKEHETSREDPAWGHGAFTKAILDAFDPDDGADADHNGLITTTELADYIGNAVPALTGGRQTPGIEIRYFSNLFASWRE